MCSSTCTHCMCRGLPLLYSSKVQLLVSLAHGGKKKLAFSNDYFAIIIIVNFCDATSLHNKSSPVQSSRRITAFYVYCSEPHTVQTQSTKYTARSTPYTLLYTRTHRGQGTYIKKRTATYVLWNTLAPVGYTQLRSYKWPERPRVACVHCPYWPGVWGGGGGGGAVG